MEARYNVYFAGEVLAGHLPESVRERLAKVFNADQQTLDKLFSGNAQLIKRDCDEATALKYKSAMEKAGAKPILKATNTAESPSDSDQKMTPAEKIAALAAAPDEGRYSAPEKDAVPVSKGLQKNAEPDFDGIVLAPEGTAALREEERAEPFSREVDTTGLAVDAAAERLSEELPTPPPAPDTSHLDMGQVGETIPNLVSADTALTPDINAFSLSPRGTDFSDCHLPAAEALPLDLSNLDLASPGADVLEAKYRKQDTKAAPDTDHISLQD